MVAQLCIVLSRKTAMSRSRKSHISSLIRSTLLSSLTYIAHTSSVVLQLKIVRYSHVTHYLLTLSLPLIHSFSLHRTLLELGASPNYRDGKNLTPVYISITRKADPKITEALLHDHATLGTQDSQGWNEVHQVSCYCCLCAALTLAFEPMRLWFLI